MANKRPQVGIAVVVMKEGLVLLGQRKGAHGAGKWAFPGGHLEFLESPAECAARELLEETALVAKKVEVGPWANSIFDGDKHYITLFMLVREFAGEPATLEPDKCAGWQWFAWNNLPEPLFETVQVWLESVGRVPIC